MLDTRMYKEGRSHRFKLPLPFIEEQSERQETMNTLAKGDLELNLRRKQALDLTSFQK